VDHYIRISPDQNRTSQRLLTVPTHLTQAAKVLKKTEEMVKNGSGIDWVRQRALCSLYYFVAERWLELGRLSDAMACWRQIRRRNLGPASLHAMGAGLLLLQAPGSPVRRIGRRVSHKWKGWARLRTNPELVGS
jgi:hypothetical protein